MKKTKRIQVIIEEETLQRWQKIADKFFKGNLSAFINFQMIKAEKDYKG
jgi:hypothetical protein